VRTSWGDAFADYVENNLLATQRVFEAAANARTKVVLASSSSVYGDAESYPTPEDCDLRPISPYGVTKLGCEHLARAYASSSGLEVVVLRFFSVFGPRQRPDMAFAKIARALAERRPFLVYGDGHQSRDFTFVGDAVAATLAAMDSAQGGALYNVGGGSEASLREVVGICEELAGRPLDVRYGTASAGDVRRTAAETSRIRGDLGWKPATSLAAGLALQLEAAGTSVTAVGA
jgi:nucleoside-diphosphate-sugar epimerase